VIRLDGQAHDGFELVSWNAESSEAGWEARAGEQIENACAGLGHAQSLGDAGQRLRRELRVVGRHVRQHDRVRQPVLDAVAASQHVGEAMLQGEAGTQHPAAEIGAKKQFSAGIEVVRLRHDPRQRGRDHARPLYPGRRQDGAGCRRVDGLHAVGERIHRAGGGRQRTAELGS
jgi:hypothetical protein